MHNERFERVQAVFNDALALPAVEREVFLRAQCGSDAGLLAEVQSLLAAYEQENAATAQRQQAQLTQDTRLARRRLGPYEIESLLGRGGMGAVYLAHRADGQYEKKVAVKLIDLPLATDVFFERFKLERQILAGLDHPNIARMLDGGVSDDGTLYLVMTYVQGVPLDQYCRSHALSAEQRIRLFLEVCKAVQFAHQNLVVHRDLKPDNILVDDDGVPHLLDFGTAKLLSPDLSAETRGLTREGFLSFTPEYASPEQVMGRAITTASDTYSLGVLLYLLLTGHLPYTLGNFSTAEMMKVICDEPPARPGSADGAFSNGDLEAILSKALRKEPESRYTTVEQFAADLQAYLDERPVEARKGTLRYKARKFARRNRAGIAAAAVLALSLLGGVAGILWQAHKARLAQHQAEARSEQLRELSGSLLSELDDAIKQLPGSTGAQQLLVTRVLEQLDRTAQDAQGDKQTELDLVQAYTALANLQDNPYDQNIGDDAGALRSLDKALAIAQPLAVTNPQDASVLTALARAQDARGEILSIVDQSDGAAASLHSSVDTYDKLLALPGARPELFLEASSVCDTLGDVMAQDTGFADANAALAWYRKAIDLDNRALAIDSTSGRARRGLVTMQMKIGNAELDVDAAKALDDFRLSFSKLQALPPEEQKTLSMVRLHALLLRKQAFALSELGEYSAANPLFDQSMQIYVQLASADRKDFRALGDIDRDLTNQAFSYRNAADPLLASDPGQRMQNLRMAAACLAHQAENLGSMLKGKPGSDDLRTELAGVTVRLEALHYELGDGQYSEARTRSGLAVLRSAAAKNASPMILDVIVRAYMEAQPRSLGDPDLALQCAMRGVRLTHQKSPEWLLALARAYREKGQIDEARANARLGLALLPHDPAQPNKSRLYRLLSHEAA